LCCFRRQSNLILVFIIEYFFNIFYFKLNYVLKNQLEKSDLQETGTFKVDTNEGKIQPKIEIYPPLRVRLQKLNEKRVALKWSQNPKNSLIELTGYNIYINGKICGKMGPTDSIASINGINQEGEYKIFIRSYFADIESENSNEVVTRVKRKQPVNASKLTNASTIESDENNLSNQNTYDSNGSSETNSNNSINNCFF
jgi:hypothetical protein